MNQIPPTTTPVNGGRTRPSVQEVRLHPQQLQDRLIKEIQEDERYRLINDAKLRAMNQGTSSYDEFQQIWMAAHLRPMEKRDRLANGETSKVVWNSLSAKTAKGQHSPKDEEAPDT